MLTKSSMRSISPNYTWGEVFLKIIISYILFLRKRMIISSRESVDSPLMQLAVLVFRTKSQTNYVDPGLTDVHVT